MRVSCLQRAAIANLRPRRNLTSAMLSPRSSLVQRESDRPTRPFRIPEAVHIVLASQGHDLDADLGAAYGRRFGFDFSRVRVHTDTRADESARAVGARAYTVGEHVVFASGAYAPATPSGRHLIAHELAHVVQQDGAELGPCEAISEPGDALEREADRVAERVTSPAEEGHGMIPRGVPSRAPAPHLQMQRANVPMLQRQSLTERALDYVLPGQQFRRDLQASVQEAPQHVGEFLVGEVWEAIRAHWIRVLAVTLALTVAEGVIGALGAAPTGVSQIIAAILQVLVVAVLGTFAIVEVHGAVEAGQHWFSLAQRANGDPRQITEASRAFLRMLWHIVMSILAVAGVRARLRGGAPTAGASQSVGRSGPGGGSGSAAGGAEVIDLAARRALQSGEGAAARSGPARASTDGNAAVDIAEPAVRPMPAAEPAPVTPPRAATTPQPPAAGAAPGVQPVPVAGAAASSATSSSVEFVADSNIFMDRQNPADVAPVAALLATPTVTLYVPESAWNEVLAGDRFGTQQPRLLMQAPVRARVVRDQDGDLSRVNPAALVQSKAFNRADMHIVQRAKEHPLPLVTVNTAMASQIQTVPARFAEWGMVPIIRPPNP